jgi:hypothetical protein
MDEKLKEAITAVRSGDKQTAQQQLTTLLNEDPEQPQGWYLLSLLVDSPQKQAAYLSKTLALNPNHAKAKEQLATLHGSGKMAATSTIRHDDSDGINVLKQAESETLPAWLQDDGEFSSPPKPAAEMTDAAVPNEFLPDWLKEPAALAIDEESMPTPVDENPTIVGLTAQSDDEVDMTVATLRQQEKIKSGQKQAQPKPAGGKSTNALNIVLGFLIILALIVMVILAYLILS